MFTKLQVTFGVVAGVAIVVFITAIFTNAQWKPSQFGPVPSWLGLAAWGSFALVVISSVGMIAAQVLEFREKKPKKEVEIPAEPQAVAEVVAPVAVTAGKEAPAEAIVETFEATAAFEPAAEEGLRTEIESGEGLGEATPEFEDLTTDFPEFDEK
ncbi:MAG TPA: hypothetical protein VG056_15270 [Pirellulales bacterium]|nr:hypothetical protein [Pirellulales bacterium]